MSSEADRPDEYDETTLIAPPLAVTLLETSSYTSFLLCYTVLRGIELAVLAAVERHDTRHRSYCLLLLSHVDVDEDEPRDQAAKYGLKDEIDALLQFLGARGDVDDDRFPE